MSLPLKSIPTTTQKAQLGHVAAGSQDSLLEFQLIRVGYKTRGCPHQAGSQEAYLSTFLVPSTSPLKMAGRHWCYLEENETLVLLVVVEQ